MIDYNQWHYRQIAPCTTGTLAVLDNLDGTFSSYPVLCWALIDEDNEGDPISKVTGLIYGENGLLESCETISNFHHYEDACQPD